MPLIEEQAVDAGVWNRHVIRRSSANIVLVIRIRSQVERKGLHSPVFWAPLVIGIVLEEIVELLGSERPNVEWIKPFQLNQWIPEGMGPQQVDASNLQIKGAQGQGQGSYHMLKLFKILRRFGMRRHKRQESITLLRGRGVLSPERERILSPKRAELISQGTQARNQDLDILAHPPHGLVSNGQGVCEQGVTTNRFPLG